MSGHKSRQAEPGEFLRIMGRGASMIRFGPPPGRITSEPSNKPEDNNGLTDHAHYESTKGVENADNVSGNQPGTVSSSVGQRGVRSLQTKTRSEASHETRKAR